MRVIDVPCEAEQQAPRGERIGDERIATSQLKVERAEVSMVAASAAGLEHTLVVVKQEQGVLQVQAEYQTDSQHLHRRKHQLLLRPNSALTPPTAAMPIATRTFQSHF